MYLFLFFLHLFNSFECESWTGRQLSHCEHGLTPGWLSLALQTSCFRKSQLHTEPISCSCFSTVAHHLLPGALFRRIVPAPLVHGKENLPRGFLCPLFMVDVSFCRGARLQREDASMSARSIFDLFHSLILQLFVDPQQKHSNTLLKATEKPTYLNQLHIKSEVRPDEHDFLPKLKQVLAISHKFKPHLWAVMTIYESSNQSVRCISARCDLFLLF